MAPGSDPPHTHRILSLLKDLCCGLALCGAGAGGFAVLISRAYVSKQDLLQRIEELNRLVSVVSDCVEDRSAELSLHEVCVDEEGLNVRRIAAVNTSALGLTELICQ
jgi:hypothetical protein